MQKIYCCEQWLTIRNSSDLHLHHRYCGMCHSDLHTVDGSWGVNKYPIAVGHELGGIVTEVRRYFLQKMF